MLPCVPLDIVPVNIGDCVIVQGSRFPTQFVLDRTGFSRDKEVTKAKQPGLTRSRGLLLCHQASSKILILMSTLHSVDLLLNSLFSVNLY